MLWFEYDNRLEYTNILASPIFDSETILKEILYDIFMNLHLYTGPLREDDIWDFGHFVYLFILQKMIERNLLKDFLIKSNPLYFPIHVKNEWNEFVIFIT